MNDNRDECSFTGCTRAVRSLGLCSGHYYQSHRGQELRPLRPTAAARVDALCSVDECGRRPVAFGLCQSHRKRQKAGVALGSIRGVQPSQVRDETGRKHCARCGEWKAEGQFHGNARQADGLDSNCTVCARVKSVMIRFNLTESAYWQMLEQQRGVCAICGDPPNGKSLSVDHDHGCCPERGRSCGKCVRALLCAPCNTAIDSMRDDPSRLRAAAAYLDGFE